jgi:phosphoribosylformylglycinamidine synthase
VLLDTPTLASKRWVYEQYDSTVQASTAAGPGSDAGVTQVPGTTFGIAVTVDCNSRLVALDPYEGGKATVAEAARNIACSGAVPLGITDCLNFGNPEKPEVFFQFREACRGIADACVAFGTPVTGGNVSFYNENPSGAIDPTPTVGMVGILESLDCRVSSFFRNMGDAIIILGRTEGILGGSALWAEVDRFVGGAPAPVDLQVELKLQHFLATAAREKLSARPTIAARAAWLSPWPSARSAGPMPRPPSARRSTSRRMRATSTRSGSCSVRIMGAS